MCELFRLEDEKMCALSDGKRTETPHSSPTDFGLSSRWLHLLGGMGGYTFENRTSQIDNPTQSWDTRPVALAPNVYARFQLPDVFWL